MEPSPAGPVAAAEAPPERNQLSAAALAKREARAARQQERDAQDGGKGEEEGETMWENTYAFSSFSLRVQEEFGGESCVGCVR